MPQPQRMLQRPNSSRCPLPHQERRVLDGTRPDTPERHPRRILPRPSPAASTFQQDLGLRHQGIQERSFVPSSQKAGEMTMTHTGPTRLAVILDEWPAIHLFPEFRPGN